MTNLMTGLEGHGSHASWFEDVAAAVVVHPLQWTVETLQVYIRGLAEQALFPAAFEFAVSWL